MTAAQRLREEGRLEGRQEGRLEGRQEGRLEGRQEGRLEGREEGRLEGRQELTLYVMQQRFGNQVGPHVAQRLRTATVEQIEAWSVRALTATSVAELFADTPASSM